jgi:hypothetical protein
VCLCGGDRTVRHNAVRDVVYEEAAEAGCRPEREKQGLLPGGDADDSRPPAPEANRRRPADVWLPRGPAGGQEAWDFAVTSGMQATTLRQASAAPELLFERYETRKREHLRTAAQCAAIGLRFTPVVFEGHAGGWSPRARGVVDWMARQGAAARGEPHGDVSLRIAQRISCTLHREAARAVLRRTCEAAPRPRPGPWGGTGDAWQ